MNTTQSIQVDTVNAVVIEETNFKERSTFSDIIYSLRSNKGAVIGISFLLLLVIVALFAPLLSPYSPIAQFKDAILSPPAWQAKGSIHFLLGTDDIGRDILSRLIYGTRFSLLIGLGCVLLASITGTLLGLISGYAGKTTDYVLMRIIDIIMALPSLLLAMAIVAILGPGLVNAMIAIAIVQIPAFVRLTRASTMEEKNKEYVTASLLMGASWPRILFITILPNCLSPLIIQLTLGFSNALLDVAALGFLGLGAQPPTPEWGSMLSNALQFIQEAWWIVTFPGLVILLTVLALNLFGDGLRDALDPKIKK